MYNSRCSYDYLEIWEGFSANATSVNNSRNTKRLCGDWSSKLKLLRYVSDGSKLKLRFSSDYSHHYGGFKVRVSTENGKVSFPNARKKRAKTFNKNKSLCATAISV